MSDRSKISAFLTPRKPYSDFNFTNLWCWDTQSRRRISLLNGNLVVLFTDYLTNETVLSFCGKKKPVSTARELLAYAKQHHLSPELRYIPESCARHLRRSSLHLIPDRGNHDYVYSTKEIARSEGVRFKKKRQQANRFIREYPEAVFKIENLSDPTVQSHVISTLRRWQHMKGMRAAPDEIEHETVALKRLLQTAKNHKVVLSSIYFKNTMLAFSVDEILPRGYAISHFLKADASYKGVYEYLNQMTAAYLFRQGVRYWNWEQDLDIDGLRQLKVSYRPVELLKKYRLTSAS